MHTRTLRLVTFALLASLHAGCMISPEHGDRIDSIFDDVTFNILSPWANAPYVIETAQLDANDEVVQWNFLSAGNTDTLLATDIDGVDIYYDAVQTAILIGWKPAPVPGCGNIDPNCGYKVRIRTRVTTPWGSSLSAKTFDNGTTSCRNGAWTTGGADQVITDCTRADDWVEILANGP